MNNTLETPFKSEFLYKSCNLGIYELYVDGSTGWGITFPNGYIEVEDGPHQCVSRMIGEINGISISAKGYDVTSIPDKYWVGDMSNEELVNFLDKLVSNYKKITKR
jgi:hypothetical protein